MFCNKCGAELPDDAVFCNKCGTKVLDSIDNSEDISKNGAYISDTSPEINNKLPSKKRRGCLTAVIVTAIVITALFLLIIIIGATLPPTSKKNR